MGGVLQLPAADRRRDVHEFRAERLVVVVDDAVTVEVVEGHVELRKVIGSFPDVEGAQVGKERWSVQSARLALALVQAFPCTIGHHASEKTLSFGGGVGGQGWPGTCPMENPREWRLIGDDESDEIRASHRCTQRDYATEAVSEEDDGSASRLEFSDGEQVVNVVVEVEGGK